MDMEDRNCWRTIESCFKSKAENTDWLAPSPSLHFYLLLDSKRLQLSRYFILTTQREFLQWLEKSDNPHFQKPMSVSCLLPKINRASQNFFATDISLQICHCCNFLQVILKKTIFNSQNIFHYEIFQECIKAQRIIKGKRRYPLSHMSTQMQPCQHPPQALFCLQKQLLPEFGASLPCMCFYFYYIQTYLKYHLILFYMFLNNTKIVSMFIYPSATCFCLKNDFENDPIIAYSSSSLIFVVVQNYIVQIDHNLFVHFHCDVHLD